MSTQNPSTSTTKGYPQQYWYTNQSKQPREGRRRNESRSRSPHQATAVYNRFEQKYQAQSPQHQQRAGKELKRLNSTKKKGLKQQKVGKNASDLWGSFNAYGQYEAGSKLNSEAVRRRSREQRQQRGLEGARNGRGRQRNPLLDQNFWHKEAIAQDTRGGFGADSGNRLTQANPGLHDNRFSSQNRSLSRNQKHRSKTPKTAAKDQGKAPDPKPDYFWRRRDPLFETTTVVSNGVSQFQKVKILDFESNSWRTFILFCVLGPG